MSTTRHRFERKAQLRSKIERLEKKLDKQYKRQLYWKGLYESHDYGLSVVIGLINDMTPGFPLFRNMMEVPCSDPTRVVPIRDSRSQLEYLTYRVSTMSARAQTLLLHQLRVSLHCDKDLRDKFAKFYCLNVRGKDGKAYRMEFMMSDEVRSNKTAIEYLFRNQIEVFLNEIKDALEGGRL